MRPILTIAIPTYNRIDKLKLCLNSIISQSNEKIEIIISDNASTDGTKNYMENLYSKNNKIRYYRNDKNLGPDSNFLNCYKKATGEYIMIFGDDDVILPGMIDNVVGILEKEKPIFMHLNHSDWLMDTLESDTLIKHGKPRLKEEGIKVYVDKNAFLEEVGIFITYISSLIMKTELINEIKNIEQYIGSYFIQSHIAMNVMKEAGKYIIDTYNCIASTNNVSVEYDVYYVWVESLKRIYFETAIQCGFNEQLMEKLYYRELQNYVLNYIYKYRKTCKNSKSWNKASIRKSLHNRKKLEMVFQVIIYCPIFLLPVVKRIMNLVMRFGKNNA